ncbi:MAG: hypothetical protein QOC80_1976, partial [Frankiaceae bacterium]|nr:hypothetical protein [Frankiaceae bacterium]
ARARQNVRERHLCAGRCRVLMGSDVTVSPMWAPPVSPLVSQLVRQDEQPNYTRAQDEDVHSDINRAAHVAAKHPVERGGSNTDRHPRVPPPGKPPPRAVCLRMPRPRTPMLWHRRTCHVASMTPARDCAGFPSRKRSRAARLRGTIRSLRLSSCRTLILAVCASGGVKGGRRSTEGVSVSRGRQ